MSNKSQKLVEHRGSVSVNDEELTEFLERAFQGETPNEVNVFPMDRKGGWTIRLTQLYHYDVKANEKIAGSRAAELGNIISSEIAKDCTSRNKGEWHYEVEVVDNHRGGKLRPVATKHIREIPRFPQSRNETDDADDTDDGYGGARKAMVDLIRLGIENEREKETNGLQAANETSLVLLDANKDLQNLVRQLIGEVRKSAQEAGEAARETVKLAIEDKDHEEDRLDRRAARDSKHLLVTFAADTLKEIKALFPSVAAMLFEDVTGKESPKRLPAHKGESNGSNGKSEELAIDVGPSEERTLVTKILDAIKEHNLEEILFGTDDEEGNPVSDGIFTRDQGRVLVGVKEGRIKASGLDPLIPTSGSPLAITDEQLKNARPKLPLRILGDIMKLMVMRNIHRRGTITSTATTSQE